MAKTQTPRATVSPVDALILAAGNAAGTTVILTTHYLEEAESLCRNIAIIDHGEIVENTSMNGRPAEKPRNSIASTRGCL